MMYAYMDRLHLLICYSVQFLILEFMRQTCHDWFLMLYLSLRKIHSWVLYICKMILQYHLGSRCSAKRWLLFYSSIILNQNVCSVNHLTKRLFVFSVLSLSFYLFLDVVSLHPVVSVLYLEFIIAPNYYRVNTFYDNYHKIIIFLLW